MTDLNAPAGYCELISDAVLQANGYWLSPVEVDLAMQWEAQGIPISVVIQAIEQKAARLKPGQRLRLLWIQDDLAEVFENWRRAVGK